jgi:transposase
VETLTRQVEQLTEQVAKLTDALEEVRRGGKRQAAPFRKSNTPKPKPKKPGRKSGKRHGPHAHRNVPPRVDETYDVPLPSMCPCCGGRQVEETHVAVQYQTEIPRRPIHRRFDIHVGVCRDCKHAVQPRHRLQTSDALGAAGNQLGPDAHAAMALLNKQLGVSHGKIARLLGQLFGQLFDIPIARATSARSMLRSAGRCQHAYETIRRAVRGSPWVVPDETGWRVGGKNAWLHAFVSETATYYAIGNRSADVAEQLLGSDWSGTMIHDGWSVYDRFDHAFHQQCLGHLQRRCRELCETSTPDDARFPHAVLTLIDRAFALRRAWRGHRCNRDGLAEAGLLLSDELDTLASDSFSHEPNRRLAGHIRKHAMHWFWFLIDPTIDATNYRAEQAIRPAVVNRKVWGGNRTWIGAQAQSILTSLFVTLRRRDHNPLDWLSQALTAQTPFPLPA